MNNIPMWIYSITVALFIATCVRTESSIHQQFLSDREDGINVIQDVKSDDSSTETQISKNSDEIGETDFVKIEVETIDMDFAKLKVKFHLNEYNRISIYGFYKDDFDYKTVFYEYHHALKKSEHKDLFELLVNLPQDLMYYNEQNKIRPTNYFASYLGFKATLDLVDPVDGEIVASVHGDLHNISFPAPWDRDHLPIYCLSWKLYIQDAILRKEISTCKLLSESQVFSTVLPIAGTRGGFVRKLPELNWPEHVPEHIKEEYSSISKFSFSMWFFLTKSGGESYKIFQTRNSSDYHSPMLILNEQVLLYFSNQSGYLHVQLHSVNGDGEAFLSSVKIPLFVWVFVHLTVESQNAELTLNCGDNHDETSNTVHHSFQRYVFGGNNSLVVVGGYRESHGFRGYSGPVHIYRYSVVHYSKVKRFLSATRLDLDKLKLHTHHVKCEMVKRIIHDTLGVIDNRAVCIQENWWQREEQTLRVDQALLSDVITKRYRYTAAMMRHLAVKLKLSNISSFEEIADKIHARAMKGLTKKRASVRLFSISGCLGQSESFFIMATIYKYGVSLSIDGNKSLKYHLIAAGMNNAMSQRSLAYRHLLGVDDFIRDVDIRAGYMRQAAVTSKLALDDEKHQVNTESEMIRLDEAHRFRDERGEDSQLFKWLSYQANMGLSDAQNSIADMLFHGKQGMDANPQMAVEYFRDAAAGGDAMAMYNLGVLHLKGTGSLNKNVSKAMEYFKESAKHNSSVAFNVLGFMEHEYNDNRTGAMYYWEKAIEQGGIESYYNYAAVLESGGADGNSTDMKRAVELYREAASQGERHSCMKYGDLLVEGVVVDRDIEAAILYHGFLAGQLQELGLYMRDAVNDYLNGRSYSAFLNYLMAFEGGLELAGYNVALLLEEDKDTMKDTVELSDEFYYYKTTSEFGWSLSLMKMGDIVWNRDADTRLASQYYAQSIEKNGNPQALFNLAYIIEHGFELFQGLTIDNIDHHENMRSNLTMAGNLYRSCIESVSENAEGFYPCHLALAKVKIRLFLNGNAREIQIILCVILLLVVMLTVVMAMYHRRQSINIEPTNADFHGENNNDAETMSRDS